MNSSTFRDKSLQASGIKEETQKSIVRLPVHESKKTAKKDLSGDAFFRTVSATDSWKPEYKEVEIDRYQAGTFDHQFQPAEGDDLVMVYIDLNRQPVQYVQPKFNRVKTFYRVRYQNPAKHTDKFGEPMKYQSPPGSGSHIWLPELIIRAYEQEQEIETLLVCEGEKKADKCTQEGVPAVGISGIHNIAVNNQLPVEFDKLIRACKIKNIVFLLDSDIFDLSVKKGKPANSRPYNFYSAVKNFRNYFRALSNEDIDVEIFFAYTLPNGQNEKGIDDLLAGSLNNSEKLFQQELSQMIRDKNWTGHYLKVHKITTDSEGKIKQLFGLSNAEEFARFYGDKLRSLGEKFKFWNTEWKFKENGSIELAQPLLPEEMYWSREFLENGKELINFNYYNCYNFLQARGFGRYPIMGNHECGEFIYVKKEGKVVLEIKPNAIKDFVHEFTENIGEIAVLNMLYRGNKYLGPDSLSNLKLINPEFLQPNKDFQYLFFQSKYWKISAQGIEEHPLHDLPASIWKNKILPFEPTLISGFISVSKETGTDHQGDLRTFYSGEFSREIMQSHYFLYLVNASRIYWRETHPLDKNEKTKKLTDEQEYEQTLSILSKMIAMGYAMHSYRNPAKTKSIICMDIKLSEVGQSYGRSGKSLLGVGLEQMMPTVFIDGKKKDLERDPFLFEEVDERTELIFIDDADKSIDFESFFTIITGRLTVNKKGKSKYKIPKEKTPKLLITTNHAINGDSDSFLDRQVLLGFSDYYSAKRKPVDDFGCLFFEEWDHEQWNLFYNLMAYSLLLYFQHDIIDSTNAALIKRRLRQEMGEEFLAWAEVYFMEDADKINQRILKEEMFNALLESVPSMKKYMTPTAFKKRIKKYCEYKAYSFNPQKKGEDDKSNGMEYFVVANANFKLGFL